MLGSHHKFRGRTAKQPLFLQCCLNLNPQRLAGLSTEKHVSRESQPTKIWEQLAERHGCTRLISCSWLQRGSPAHTPRIIPMPSSFTHIHPQDKNMSFSRTTKKHIVQDKWIATHPNQNIKRVFFHRKTTARPLRNNSRYGLRFLAFVSPNLLLTHTKTRE